MKRTLFCNPNGGTVKDFHELWDKIMKFPGGTNISRIYFRGQANASWGLKPTIAREYCFIGKTIKAFSVEQERNFLHRFRRRAYTYYNRTISEWEAIFLARHHGLPVRLLDWTTNPLVALYNACAFDDKPRSNGAIWAFLARDQAQKNYIDVFTEKRSPLDIKGVKIIYPIDTSPRMVVQSGVFTIQDNPKKELQEYNPTSYGRKDFDLQSLIRWTVPKDCKSSIIEYLERNAINARMLFPDLDGLAKGTWQTEVVRYGLPK